MANKAQTVTKRLLHELQSYENDPSPALAHLGPVNDDELLHWTAVLKGVDDTAYAGKPIHLLSFFPSNLSRRPLGPLNNNPTTISTTTTNNQIPNPDLSSERALQDGRDLPGSPQDVLESGVYDRADARGRAAVADER